VAEIEANQSEPVFCGPITMKFGSLTEIQANQSEPVFCGPITMKFGSLSHLFLSDQISR